MTMLPTNLFFCIKYTPKDSYVRYIFLKGYSKMYLQANFKCKHDECMSAEIEVSEYFGCIISRGSFGINVAVLQETGGHLFPFPTEIGLISLFSVKRNKIY